MDGRWGCACGIAGQRPSLDWGHLSRPANGSLSLWLGRNPLLLWDRIICFGTGVVVSDLHADLTCVLALAIEAEPLIALASTGRDDRMQICVRLSNQLRLLVVVEDADLEAVVVG